MNQKKILILIAVAAVLIGGVVGVGLLTAPSDDSSNPSSSMPTTSPLPPTEDTELPEEPTDPDEPIDPDPQDPTLPSDPTVSTDPTIPDDPTDPTDPIIPDDPTDPTDPIIPDDPTDPADPPAPPPPDDPVIEPDPLQEAKLLVTREDGTVASGAAVIATGLDGYQEYEPTDEHGLAVLNLPKGSYAVRIFLDGCHADAELEMGDSPVEMQIQLKPQRQLYILFEASGDHDCPPGELGDYAILEKAIKAQYPEAVYLTPEERYNVRFRDGDALLSIKVFVENYTAADQYFASEIWVNFTAYQECITVWSKDEGGEEIEIEYLDGNVCSVQIRNDYDYEYQNSVCIITESFYHVQRDWHLSKFAPRADAWGYGYELDTVRSSSADQKVKAPGAGMKAEAFWAGVNSSRYQSYLTYAQQLWPYIDLWLSGNWNEEIEQTINQQG